MVNIEDFKKLDIRIGKIISAERIPGSDKLLKLLFDVGEAGPRQILAGIAEHVEDPNSLVGKELPLILNLEPRKMRGEISYGMIIIIFVLTFITTLTQKYGTDQETLKELKKEQKKLNEEMKEFRNDPAKIMELQKKQFEFMAPMMKISMRPIIYTGIPFLLFFRWFMDYFGALGQCGFFCNQYSIFYGWLIFYILFSIIFSIILRKVFDVA